jgi:ribosomal protein S18 acetylase RimI-like enzyme
LLSRAFLTEPHYLAIWRRQDEVAARKIETVFRTAVLNRPVATSWIARRGEELVGVLSMVEWPHCQLSALESLRLAPRMVTLFGAALPRAMRIEAVWRKHDPQEPHWHLGPVGVVPEYQGQGIGSRLMEVCCEFLDERKDAAHLDTDRPENVGFYEKSGFTVYEEEAVLGFSNWFMRRPPR